ncbi:uncharacterized protein THITE_2106054 [Thermothielavioides terrestris NRRL 8126]|uniref:Transcription factor domain-containing protein n=2 Tax=Thermothielavioides terrestris TaxID=2587410 RepID=G2QW06_THETT|nr:uncharacterized protein THITE_2106054 [Thermothielavioides terrestris NRRL 8126]AEO62177.1 hypothetical protein THITE_2106054 [Thermothielavioides terrestris NRRL 8126]
MASPGQEQTVSAAPPAPIFRVARATPETAPLEDTAPSQIVVTSETGTTGSRKRSRAHFQASTPLTYSNLDPISTGLITLEDAESYFSTFFSGCDRYVPVFCPLSDSFESVRSRSSVLLSAICSVGCRILTGSESHHSRALNLHTQRIINAAVAAAPIPGMSWDCLETVQALLVRACYAPERSLLIALATRMALEIGLPEAYGDLCTRCLANPPTRSQGGSKCSDGSATAPGEVDENDATLMRKTRTWLHLVMMGQILHVDAGGPPGFRLRGAAQRCRVLINGPSSTGMDLYLISQVELNAIRARIYSTFSQYAQQRPREHDDDEIMEMLADARIDINVWFEDWTRIYEKHQTQMPWLSPNLAVQRCWADSMAMCAALKATGIEDVSAMSSAGKEILRMAKQALRQHLDIILEEPRLYLRDIRYAMDFVWAKNAFCYLLLLKLAVLLPEDGLHSSSVFNDDLIEKGRMLVDELSKSEGGLGGSARNNTASAYLHLIRVSIDKFSKAVRSWRQNNASHGLLGEPNALNDGEFSCPGPERANEPAKEGQHELESFVPEQFVFEWDFPGLTWFSSLAHETSWLDNMLGGVFDGSETFDMWGYTSQDYYAS